jgi:hypothetical protein
MAPMASSLSAPQTWASISRRRAGAKAVGGDGVGHSLDPLGRMAGQQAAGHLGAGLGVVG